MRETFLNWPIIRYICGRLLLLEAMFMAMSAVVALVCGGDGGPCSPSNLKGISPFADCLALVVPALLCGLCGWVLLATARKHSQRVTEREGYLIVAVMWVIFSVFGMLPFLFTGACSSVTDAFLETMSGFTTTGCTVLNDIDSLPRGLLFWRSMTQWMGGLGIVVFSLALMPKIASGNVQMFSAEVTGMTVDKLRPTIQATSRRLWMIYVGLTLLCALLYGVGGMSVYDAICHSLTTLATGGFSTHQASIGYFHSAYIEYVCSIFLFIASVNFSLFYMVGHGKFSQFWRNEEFRWFTFIVIGFIALFFGLHVAEAWRGGIGGERLAAMPQGGWDMLRASVFHVLTIISTCGFQGECYDYVLWGHVFWFPTLFIMAVGGCAGSTAGGLKVLRVVVLIKNLRTVIQESIFPNVHATVMLDGSPLRMRYVRRTLAFVFLFFMVAMAGIFVMTLQGLDIETAIGTTISAMGNCGPGLGMTGPAFTWASLPALSKWMLSFLMLVGRLEIFTVILLFTRSFWHDR